MNVWRAMARNPVRFVFSSWPWRSLAYLATTPLVAVLWLAVVAVLLLVGVVLAPLVVGFGVLACVPLTAVVLASVERWRLRWLDPRAAPSAHRAVPDGAGTRARVLFRLRESATWRELGYALLFSVLAAVDLMVPFAIIVGSTVAVGAPYLVANGDRIMYGSFATVDEPLEAWLTTLLGLAIALAGCYAFAALAGGRAALARALLVRAPAEELIEVRASRARLADAFEAERRRIERDLHDGAQQRLTGLIMTLGLARLDGAAPDLIDKAQAEARAALEELRDLVHGIHPSVLTDRGLAAAVDSLADRSPVPVDVDVELPERPPEPVESAAYFVVAEALANVAKHSGASLARVRIRRGDGTLLVEVQDDGGGGAEPAQGGGLQGLADRAAVHDGTLRLSSPPGGPTILRVEIPCAS
ncbi:sensor histidine kinase [Actinocorallia libanotica]|uniref:histidine kinase n=1 Tax=Actinocorallia libanotica TaxID=46162 RepID=A0ABN1Q5P0_9ACTN